jgi:hypothetical protein
MLLPMGLSVANVSAIDGDPAVAVVDAFAVELKNQTV